MPILFFGREFWERVIDFEALAEEGVINEDDLKLFSFCETAEEAWAHVCAHYRVDNGRLDC
jgi:predicted Rossmann-fold nucleotide-binding protein